MGNLFKENRQYPGIWLWLMGAILFGVADGALKAVTGK
jgi:hypothetical protein